MCASSATDDKGQTGALTTLQSRDEIGDRWAQCPDRRYLHVNRPLSNSNFLYRGHILVMSADFLTVKCLGAHGALIDRALITGDI